MKKFIVLLFIANLSFSQKRIHPSFEVKGDIFGKYVFIENKGQFDNIKPGDEPVIFAYDNAQEHILFHPNGVTYFLEERHPLKEREMERMEHGKKVTQKPTDKYFVNVTWVGANSNIEVEAGDKQNHKISYGDAKYYSTCYKKITYKNVYPNIDIEYVLPEHGSFHDVKYNVVVHPGGDLAQFKANYSGDVKSLKIKDGNLNIKTPYLTIKELAPKAFQDGKTIVSNFQITESQVGFSVPNYDKTKELLIDPWVIGMGVFSNNAGYDVDYDYAGNYYVYGDVSPYLISKYSSAGILLWTFNGTAGAWTNNCGYAGSFAVDKGTQLVYTGNGFGGGSGAVIVQLNSSGVFTGLQSAQNPIWDECWDMGFYCGNSSVFGLGGSISGDGSVGLVNTSTGAMSPNNVSGIGGNGQDVVSHATDPQGKVFIIFASVQTTALNNQMMLLNPAFTGYLWMQPSTFSSFSESANHNYPGGTNPSNGFNALAANTSYLYYWDGSNLAAYNKTTGAMLASIVVPGLSATNQGGIAVDECNNLYIGGNASILCYNFTGSSFSPNGTIPVSSYVTDIKFNPNTNLLYVSGVGFGGTYNAINSGMCTTFSNTVTTTCVGNNNGTAVVTLTTNIVSPLVTYSWTNSSGTTVSTTSNSPLLSNTVNNLTNGNYTVFIQINAPCGPVTTATLNINCTCSATVLANATSSCVGVPTSVINTSLNVTSITGFTSSPITYTWSSPTGVISSASTAVVPNAAAGVYTVFVSAPNCNSNATVQVSPPVTFTPIASGTNVICYNGSNGSASVTSVNGSTFTPFTYTWSTSPPINTSLANGLSAGTYSVLVGDAQGCVYQTSVTLTQPPLAFLTLANTSVTCYGGSNGTASVSNIPVANTSPYTYTWSTSPLQHSAIAGSLSIGTVSCSLTDSKGCVFTGTTTLIQPPALSLSISSSTNYACAGTAINLTASALGGISSSYTYSWSNGASGVSTSVSNTVGGVYNYSATVTDANSCTLNAISQVTIVNNPIVLLTNKAICQGQTAILVANGASAYTWTPTTGLNAAVGSQVSASPAGTTTYTVYGYNQMCMGQGTVQVTVVSYPEFFLSANPTQICAGQTSNITATGAQNYIWSSPYIVNNNGSSALVNPPSTSQFTVIGFNKVDSTACSVQKMITIPVVPNVTPTISNSQTVCLGTNITLSAGGGNTYTWMPSIGLNATNIQNVVCSATASNVYSVNITNNGACGSSATVAVFVAPTPTAYAGRDTTYNVDDQIFISAVGSGSLTWISGENIVCSACPYTQVTPSQNSCYVIEVTNKYGCKADDEVCLIITDNFGIYIPNAFTPNGDGLNDTFNAKAYSILSFKMDVFDRWGENLFTSNDITKGWDGTYKGALCKTDVYVYKVTYKGLDGKLYYKTGTVTLLK
ncbi:MAG: gliding motility-associated C-terminal domain-containing protein [Bacteroidetes bacterium]|nr:gliding motility-associated C-terminal domain-containing protein [Bacteroidota bacterium]